MEKQSQVYLVLGEMMDGFTSDGEHVVVFGAYRDKAAAERRAEAERTGGRWGHFEVGAVVSDVGWYLSVEPVDLIG